MRRCKFCGRKLSDTLPWDYCYSCRQSGADVMHQATGRTNGWDKPKRKPVLVKGGWRGQKCMGPCRRAGGVAEDWR